MPRNAEQKIKLLVLYDILQRETDEEHPLSTDVLVEKLRECGINAAGKSVVADVKTLNDWGYEVLSFKKRSYYFYTADKYFDTAELRILIDAVQAANFISEEKTSEFVDKLASIAGRQKAEQLKRGVVCYDTNKHANRYVFYSIDALERAIEAGKQVSFYYFDHLPDGQKVYRKDKARYIVNPVALIFSQDKYYLVCYNDKYQNISNYRIDRMENVEVEESPVTPNDRFSGFNIHRHRKEVFAMFEGEPIEIEFEADNGIADKAMDKFGENYDLMYCAKEFFRFRAKVCVSPPFFAWITTHLGKIRIKSPQSVKKQLHDFLSHTYE